MCEDDVRVSAKITAERVESEDRLTSNVTFTFEPTRGNRRKSPKDRKPREEN